MFMYVSVGMPLPQYACGGQTEDNLVYTPGWPISFWSRLSASHLSVEALGL